MVRSFYKDASFLLFIHTAPQEIEWYKDRAKHDTSIIVRADQREKIQLELAKKASLVVAVGPRLHRSFETVLAGLTTGKRPVLHQMNPGLKEFDEKDAPPEQIEILLIGRTEDIELKGLDIAAQAVGLCRTAKLHLIVRGADATTAGDDLQRTLSDKCGPKAHIKVKPYSVDEDFLKQDLRRASLLIMPSRVEGFGLVGLEAIAAGTPLLISHESGLAELLATLLSGNADQYIVNAPGADAPKIWAERIDEKLLNRAAEYDNAAKLRNELKAHLNWNKEAEKIMTAIPKGTLRHGN